MAEVLGIIASAIALGQGIGAVTKGMRKVASLRAAPAEFLDLHNELVTVIRYATELEAMEDSLKDANLQLPSASLDNLRDTIHELEVDVEKLKTIVFDFEASAKVDKNGERNIRKIKWLRESKTIAQLRDSVKERRSFLSDAMICLHTSLGVAQSKAQSLIAIDIREIYSSQLPAIAESTYRLEDRVAGIEGCLVGIEEKLSQATYALSSRTNESQSRTDGSQLIPKRQFQQQEFNSFNSAICVQASASIEPQQQGCKSYCKCDCHKSTIFRSPGFMSRLVGNLLISYNSVPVWKPRSCNLQQCSRRTSNKFQLNDMFPQWMVQKCVSISISWSSIRNAGASLYLNVPRVNPDWDYGNRLLREGDISSFRNYLTAGKFLLTDVDEKGTTLLMAFLANDYEVAALYLPSYPIGMLSWKGDSGNSLVSLAYEKLRDERLPETESAVCRRILDLTDQEYPSNIIIDALLGCPDFTLETALNLEPSAINEKDGTAWTALHWAVHKNDIQSLHVLLRYRPDLNMNDHLGGTPLHIAASTTQAEILRLLVEAGSDIEARDRFGHTPLLHAARWNQPDSLDELISLGANVSIMGHQAATAFHYLSLGFPSDFMDESSMLRICLTLQQAGLDVNARDQFGATPLMDAIRRNHVALVKALALCGADYQILDNYGESILHEAARFANLETIQVLRSMKSVSVDPELENEWGATAEDILADRIHASGDELVDWDFKRLKDEEFVAFNLLISEMGERYQRRNIITLRIGYKDWKIADRRCCTQKKTSKPSRRSYNWKALTTLTKHNTSYRSILIEFPRHLLHCEEETSSLCE